VEQMKRAETIAPITSLQPNYNIVTPDIEKAVLPYCRERNIGVIVLRSDEVWAAHGQDDSRTHRFSACR